MGQLFSKKNKEVFSAPLGIDNPVTVQVLGICSALAVTAKLEPAIVMGLSVTVITAFANVVISLLRKTIPNYEPIQNIGYVNNGLMLMPPMALIIVACIIWYQRARHKELQEESN